MKMWPSRRDYSYLTMLMFTLSHFFSQAIAMGITTLTSTTTTSTTSAATPTFRPGLGPANDTLPLQPWIITRLNTGSPSGRPSSFPYSAMSLTITDPNTISLGPTAFMQAIFPPSTVDCTIRWNTYFEEPYGWVVPCKGDLSHGRWTMEMIRRQPNDTSTESWNPPSPTRNFGVKLRLEESVIMDSLRVVTKIYEATGNFSVGRELDFVCGGSGVCSSGLKGSVSVVQRLVDTQSRVIQ